MHAHTNTHTHKCTQTRKLSASVSAHIPQISRSTLRFSRIYYATKLFKKPVNTQASGSRVTWRCGLPLLPTGLSGRGVIMLLWPAVGGLGCVDHWREGEGGMNRNIWCGARHSTQTPCLVPHNKCKCHISAPFVRYKIMHTSFSDISGAKMSKSAYHYVCRE